MTELAKLIHQERSIRISALQNPNPAQLRTLLEFKLESAEITDVGDWINFAFDIEYQHPGLDPLAYLMHPLRVAVLYLNNITIPSTEGVILALLHNLLEVSTFTPAAMEELLGKSIAENIETLTVDRKKQWDWSYKESYYDRILHSHEMVGQVKIIDKLDNLYTLCLNPDDEIRQRYLAEVERWIVPMSKKLMPASVELLIDLVKETRNTGYRPINAI
jgi:(p)ppGpp synthase/HD superfamily hydrolase